jgi:hypothetical protein
MGTEQSKVESLEKEADHVIEEAPLAAFAYRRRR